MATKEEISMVGFEIVAYAGDAQTDLLAALDAAREGDFEKAEQLHKDASDALIGAHDTQTKLLSQEAGGGEMEMTFIMAHAQDTLMTISAELHMVKKMMPIVRALAIRAGQ